MKERAQVLSPENFRVLGNPTSGYDPLLRINEQRVKINASLTDDQHKRYESAMIRLAQKRMRMTEILRGRGLTADLGGIGTILSIWYKYGELTAAKVSMDGRVQPELAELDKTSEGVPVPIFAKNWYLPRRYLNTTGQNNTGGEDEAVRLTRAATRSVSESFENGLWNGHPSITVAGNSPMGLHTYANRNTTTLTAAWTNTGSRDPVADILAMVNVLSHTDNRMPPYGVFVPSNYATVLQEDYSTAKGDRTFKERILAIDEIDFVEVIPYQPASTVTMVELDPETLDIGFCQDLINVQWDSPTGMDVNFYVWMCAVLRLKSDQSGSCGICHGSEP